MQVFSAPLHQFPNLLQRMLASAVVVPEDPTPTPRQSPEPISSLKRRQTDLSEPDQTSKRARLSPAVKQEPSDHGETEQPTRRASTNIEERKRGQRMFGALLGALSQKGGSSAAAKRRADIEKKQREKLKQVAENASFREQEQLEELKERRRKEQWKWDEQSV
jgi:pinin/SDK/memA/ protein conserved region